MADSVPVFVRTELDSPDEGTFFTKADPDDLQRIVDSMQGWGINDTVITGTRYFRYGGKAGFEIILEPSAEDED